MNFIRYIQRRAFLRVGLLITGVLLIIFAILAFFGQNVGNFVVSVGEDDYYRGLALSSNKELNPVTSRLLASPMTNVRDCTYSWINIQKACGTDGDYRDPDFSYLAYTFYLYNANEDSEEGSESMDVLMNLNISSVKNGVDEAVRVLLVENDTRYKLYMKPDSEELHYSFYDYDEALEVYNFESDTVILSSKIENLRPGQSTKFSIIMWLEGEDPDCTTVIQKGKIKMNMTFKIDKVDKGEGE